MSCLWDTPEFWARIEADEMLREMNDAAPARLPICWNETLPMKTVIPEAFGIRVFRSGYASPTFAAAQTS
jgi:hypothetical protein